MSGHNGGGFTQMKAKAAEVTAGDVVAGLARTHTSPDAAPTSDVVAGKIKNDVNNVVAQVAEKKPGECIVVSNLHREDSDPTGRYSAEVAVISPNGKPLQAGSLSQQQEKLVQDALVKADPNLKKAVDSGFRSITKGLPGPCGM